MKRDMELAWVMLIVLLSLAFSFAMAIGIIWALRIFGMQIDYSWQTVLAVWITMVVIKSLFNKVKE